MDRYQLMAFPCWSCWWKEGAHCFTKDHGEIPMRPNGLRKGHKITRELASDCPYWESKREVIGRLLPPEIELIIMSEEALKKDGKVLF